MKALGVILIVLGLIGLVWGGFAYTTREKVVDIGPIHASRDKTQRPVASHCRRAGPHWRHCARGSRQRVAGDLLCLRNTVRTWNPIVEYGEEIDRDQAFDVVVQAS